jgi:hypothetical protein
MAGLGCYNKWRRISANMTINDCSLKNKFGISWDLRHLLVGIWTFEIATKNIHLGRAAAKVTKIIAPTIWLLNKSENMKLDEPSISNFRRSPHINLSFDSLFRLLFEEEQERTKQMFFGSSDDHLGDCVAH